jgi:hypothetical protein
VVAVVVAQSSVTPVGVPASSKKRPKTSKIINVLPDA